MCPQEQGISADHPITSMDVRHSNAFAFGPSRLIALEGPERVQAGNSTSDDEYYSSQGKEKSSLSIVKPSYNGYNGCLNLLPLTIVTPGGKGTLGFLVE